MDNNVLNSALEAVLFASGEPVPVARLSLVFGVPVEDILEVAASLGEYYEEGKRGIRLLHLGGSLQLCSAPEHAKLISKVIEHRAAPKLSPSALEALAIVAYFQPVTRAYVEQVRGVDSSYTVSSRAVRASRRPRPPDALPHDRGVSARNGHQLAGRAADAAGHERVRRTGEAPGRRRGAQGQGRAA